MSTSGNEAYKIVIVGESFVGKTAIIGRLIDKTFHTEFESTIGVEFRTYNVMAGDREVKLNIWDTAGQEKFRSVSKAYFRNAQGALLVFSLTDQKSFEALDGWLNDLQSLCTPNAVVLLLGNKSDLKDDRVVPNEEANAFATRHGLNYFETSALDASNIDEAFVRLATTITEKINSGEIIGTIKKNSPPVVLDASTENENKNGGCFC